MAKERRDEPSPDDEDREVIHRGEGKEGSRAEEADPSEADPSEADPSEADGGSESLRETVPEESFGEWSKEETAESCSPGAARPCYTGPPQTRNVGLCQQGIQRCNDLGEWEESCLGEKLPQKEVCNGKDDDCDGVADPTPPCVCKVGVSQACYTGPASTAGKGECRQGKQVCLHGGKWGPCTGEVKPATEKCNDGKDNDCDGLVDDGCCQPGEERTCYSGPSGTERVGLCQEGKQSCSRHGIWSACQGEVVPAKEICDQKDNDCDGLSDNGLSFFCDSAEVRVGSGSFWMGSPSSEKYRDADERRHKVRLTYSFAAFAYEVTQKLYLSVMSYNPSSFGDCGLFCPAERVSWQMALDFCNKLSQQAGLPQCFNCTGKGTSVFCAWKSIYSGNKGQDYKKCKGYRLPTEAEWEYLARAGTNSAFYNGDITKSECGLDPNLNKIGWYCGNSQVSYKGCLQVQRNGKTYCLGTHPVGQKQPNAWGFYDISGNVSEWVLDTALHWPNGNTMTDPYYLTGTGRIHRGGSWESKARYTRSANRAMGKATIREKDIGFRPVRGL